MNGLTVDVVIPAKNAAAEILATLDSLAEGRAAGLIGQVLVVDGGSGDGTPAAALAAGARVISGTCGAGRRTRSEPQPSRSVALRSSPSETYLARP